MSVSAPRLGVLAGEASGDILGAAVINALKRRHGDLQLAGIGGERMMAAGLVSSHPMDRLSVMGLVDPLKRLPELLRIRAEVCSAQLSNPPDLFLGIDSPDFNLALESRLRASGIATAHLVSPSVWAWRTGRIRKIARAVDLMLCLLPFETEVYEAAGIPAVCVGHPLIEELAALPDRETVRDALGIARAATVLAVLPGSRAGEVEHLMAVFAGAMARLHTDHPELVFIIPAANLARRTQIEAALSRFDLPVTVTHAGGREAMVAADTVLLASGTATLEAMLLGRPMVIAYRMAWLSWQLLSRMANTRWVGLPNVLAERELVPELLQDAATPEALAAAVSRVLAGEGEQQVEAFAGLSEAIGGNFAERSAEALDRFF